MTNLKNYSKIVKTIVFVLKTIVSIVKTIVFLSKTIVYKKVIYTMYICDQCNYKTTYSGNFCNHKKTQKHLKKETLKSNTCDENYSRVHLESTSSLPLVHTKTIKTIVEGRHNVDKNYSCKNCDFSTNHKSSFYRHTKTHTKTHNNNLSIKLEYAEKEVEIFKKLEKEKSEMLNNFMNNANILLNKAHDNTKITTQAMHNVSMSAIKYANEKFKNTPALLPLKNFNINNLDFNNKEDKKQLIEIMIYNSRHKSLDKLLGDHIISNYKKKKLEDQPFHTTDCSRLNYIVREVEELIENALIWSIDKNGIKICSSIIKPLIKKCINPLLEYQKELLDEMSKGDYTKQPDVELIINLIISIESGILETEINKYIAPYFNLDKNKLKEV